MRYELEMILREAGAQMLARAGADTHRKDGHCNFVTDADIAVQSFLREKLERLLPGALFFAEEQTNAALSQDPTWIVDPIDGTTNFIRGRRCSAISSALVKNGVPLLGAVYNPYADEIFSAQSGCGATLNGREIRVSDMPFSTAIVTFGTSPYNPEFAERTLRAARQFLLEGGDLRRTGSAALDLCDVACGRSDIFYEMKLSPWDVAAGALIITEAGGIFDMPFEQKVQFSQPACILASNPVCRERAKHILMEFGR